MKIAIIGKFTHLHDEEYIARSFEMLGHTVRRIPQNFEPFAMSESLMGFRPEILLYCKWEVPAGLEMTMYSLKNGGMKTVCWLFDLYFDYQRENHVHAKSYFKSDYVFTTDGGHQENFEKLGVNHACIRQGIYRDECALLPVQETKYPIVFVGSDSPVYPERSELVRSLGAKWFGRSNTNEIRGIKLNELYSKTQIVIGDSFYSPHYWSNRIVETLGRGGFLIHQDVPGLKELYPHLVTYERGNSNDLKKKIEYYLQHEEERRAIVQKNFEWVRDNYTMEKQCKKLLDHVVKSI